MSALRKKWFQSDTLDLAENNVSTHSECFREYTKVSSIHGIKYIGNRGTHIFEKAFWLIALLISLIFCTQLMINIWNKWDDGPTIVDLADKPKPIWDIPFPAVTICPETKSKASIFNFTEFYHIAMNVENQPYQSLEDDMRKKLEAVVQLCDSHIGAALYSETEATITNMTIIDTLRAVAPSMEEVLFICKLRNEPKFSCKEFFSEVWTEEGLCFTYNILNSTNIYRNEMTPDVFPIINNYTFNQWSNEYGYVNNIAPDINTYPHRAHSAGARGGLTVLLRLYDYDFEYICRGPVLGFKVLLHPPDEFPHISKHFFRVPLNVETKVVITPKVTEISNHLKDYEPDKRSCYYKSERKLKYYKDYSQTHCELECLSNYIVKKCGCAKFSLPRDPNTAICSAHDIDCYHSAENELLDNNLLDGVTSDKTDCNCLPSCTSITYDLELSNAAFDWKSLFTAFGSPTHEYQGTQNSRLNIVFKDSFFIPIKRYKLRSNTEILALCGGLLAFFFGASLLSFLEIIYFFTWRLLYSKPKVTNEPGTEQLVTSVT